jgi:methyltransferase (TIGR00027 family)
VSDKSSQPDSSAIRVALWRALHLEQDAAPPVFEDRLGIEIAAPEEGWRERPDMGPFTRLFRAAIIARARFIDDLVIDQAAKGVTQYVILGAGLDTFAQRRPDIASRLNLFEIDQPGPQAWKQERLTQLGYVPPKYLHFVPVDFEAGAQWPAQLAKAGFEARKPAVIASTGVSMYLTKEANAATLRDIAKFTPGSTLAMTFIVPIEMASPEVRPGMEASIKGARASGTPFLSFYTPDEMLAAAHEAGFKSVEHVSMAMLAERYFSARSDGLRPPPNSEEFLVART